MVILQCLPSGICFNFHERWNFYVKKWKDWFLRRMYSVCGVDRMRDDPAQSWPYPLANDESLTGDEFTKNLINGMTKTCKLSANKADNFILLQHWFVTNSNCAQIHVLWSELYKPCINKKSIFIYLAFSGQITQWRFRSMNIFNHTLDLRQSTPRDILCSDLWFTSNTIILSRDTSEWPHQMMTSPVAGCISNKGGNLVQLTSFSLVQDCRTEKIDNNLKQEITKVCF